MESLGLPNGAPTMYWEDDTGCISIFETKWDPPRVKQININRFYKINTTMVYLLVNTRQLTSSHYICALNPARVSLSSRERSG